jgi:hypothetical protein
MNLKRRTPVNLEQMNRYFFWIIIFLFFACNNDEAQIGIEVCEHFNNADATIIQCSDQYYDHTATYNINRQYSAEVAEFEALKNNIPIHVFEEKTERGLKEFIQMGRGGLSAYYPSCFFEYKKSKLDSILEVLSTVYGRNPTTIAYGCGKTHYRDSLPNYILGGRNSSHGSPSTVSKGIPICTYYGNDSGDPSIYPVQSASFIKSRLCASRSWTNVLVYDLSEEESLSFIKNEIENTISKSGFYLDFMHWHIDAKESKNAQKFIPKLFNTFKEAIANSYVAKVDYNQAIEYLYAKSSIDSVSLIEEKEFYQMTVYTKKHEDIDYSVIKTPVSFKTLIDIKNEELNKLGGENIKSITEIKDKLIINAFIDFNKKVNKIVVYKNAEPKFLSLECEAYFKDNAIYSKNPIKVTFFRKDKHDEEYKVEIIKRSLNFKLKHEFKIDSDPDKYNYFAGIINQLGESKIIKIGS